MKRAISAFIFLLFGGSVLFADNFKVPSALKDFSSSSIYSVLQDRDGAIWLNTNKGMYRFNGNGIEFLANPMLGVAAVFDGKENVYSVTSRYLSKFDVKSRKHTNIVVSSSSLDQCSITASGDSVFIAMAEKIYLETHDSTILFRSLPKSFRVTTLLHLPDSGLIAGTEEDGVVFCRPEGVSTLFKSSDRVESLYRDPSGKVWCGFQKSGLICLDPITGSVLSSCSSCRGVPFSSVRSISSDSSGNVYFATVKGLFKYSPDGRVSEMSFDGTFGYPFRCVFVDRDDNVWAGSYYNGVFYSNNFSYPFEDLPFGPSVRLSKGLVRDRRGILWLFTDNFGAYRSSDGAVSWRLVPGTEDIKFQGAYYDDTRDEIWTSEYQGDLMCFRLPSLGIRRYPVETPDVPGEYFGPVVKRGDEFFLGGTNGVYVFNPRLERSVSRRIPGLSSRVYDLAFGPDGKLWIAAKGLYFWSDGDVPRRFVPDSGPGAPFYNLVPDIAFDGKGRLWASCVGSGVVLVDSGAATVLSSSSVGFPDNHFSFVEPIGGPLALVGTSDGIAIVDSDKMTAYNYNSSNGLSLSSGRWACTCRLPDGTILVGGSDGIEMMRPSEFNPGGEMPVPVIDRLDVNGKMFDCNLAGGKTVDLSYRESNFSFAVTSFDYSKVAAVTYYYMLEGYDEDWLPLGPSFEAQYMNMSPGRYVFRVRAERGGDPASFDSVRVVIHPAWYSTLAAKVGFALVALLLAGLLLYFLYSKTVLSDRLAARERENEEKTRFFVDISYQLRTPLNLIIGQLETFFRNYGARTAGIADIEDVYGKAKKMRSLISDYVDSQNDELEKASAVRDAKFLNAAIGAVERNLYAGKLDISVLCRELNVGKTTLTARLRDVSGMTPRAFIEDIRLKHAAEMLQDGNLRVSEVSDRLGFSSPRYFSGCFRKKFGCIPSEYRR